MKINFKNAALFIMAGLVLTGFVLTGCSKKASKNYTVDNFNGVSGAKFAARGYSPETTADQALYEDVEYEMAEESPAYSESGELPPQEYERKLILTGNVNLEVKSLTGSEEKISSWAKGLGGYITSANVWDYGANFTVRVPAARFDDAMAQTGDFGHVTSRSVNSQDVSDSYYDLQSRLQTKYILRDKLTGYLNQAKDIKDLLEIERQLNSVIEEIESTESRLKRLSGQVDYSTIYLNLQFERGKDESGIILPDVKDSWNQFLSNVIAFFWSLLKLLFYIVIYGIPIVALAAFFFWLLFGKVGLLVKLFKKLKK